MDAPDDVVRVGDLLVRPYETKDRSAVRYICYVTGYMGEPIDWQWKDARSIADTFTGYYTDKEPESALVVENRDGEVVGYLLGCVDSRRAPTPEKVIIRHVFTRGIAFMPGTAGFVWRSAWDIVTDAITGKIGLSDRKLERDPRWPAHLHIDLLPETVGRGVGSALMKIWLDRLRYMKVPGCHLGTLAENHRAIAYFEAMGFRKEGNNPPVPGERTRDGKRLHSQLMVQELHAITDPPEL